jgi:DNA-binding transcriptional LysR family regulator
VGYLKLFDERLVPACSPAFLAANPVAGPRDLLALPLLQIETRPMAWAAWFARHGVEERAPLGMMFDQFAQMILAAIDGLGVALLPEFLAGPELADGRLVAVGDAVPSEGSYFLVWPQAGEKYPPLAAFRDWLEEETRSATSSGTPAGTADN